MYSYLKALSLFDEQQKCRYQQRALSRSNFAIGIFLVVTDCNWEKSAGKISQKNPDISSLKYI